MRVLIVGLALMLAGCVTDGDAAEGDHDHSDHDHGDDMDHMDGRKIMFDEDDDTDMLTVTKAEGVDWGKTTATLTDGCTAYLQTESMGAPIDDGPFMSHRHDASVGDTIQLEGTGTCTIRLDHDGVDLGSYTFDMA